MVAAGNTFDSRRRGKTHSCSSQRRVKPVYTRERPSYRGSTVQKNERVGDLPEERWSANVDSLGGRREETTRKKRSCRSNPSRQQAEGAGGSDECRRSWSRGWNGCVWREREERPDLGFSRWYPREEEKRRDLNTRLMNQFETNALSPL